MESSSTVVNVSESVIDTMVQDVEVHSGPVDDPEVVVDHGVELSR